MSKLSLKQLIKFTLTASQNWMEINDLDNDWRGLTFAQKKKMNCWAAKEELYTERANKLLVEMGVFSSIDGAESDEEITALRNKLKDLGFDPGYSWHFGNGWC